MTTPPNTTPADSEPITCINCAFCSMWDCSCIFDHPMPQGYDTPANTCPDFEPEIIP